MALSLTLCVCVYMCVYMCMCMCNKIKVSQKKALDVSSSTNVNILLDIYYAQSTKSEFLD